MNDKQVKSLIKQGEHGRHSVGNGLYLRIANQNIGYWVVRYTTNKKRREVTIGKYPELSLADAKYQAAKIKSDVNNGIDPIAESNRQSIANDCLMYCKQLFRHPVKLDLRTSNPTEAFTISDAGGIENSGSRALTLDELTLVFKCFRENQNQFTRENYLAVALLLCLGVRKGELIAVKWNEFNFDKALWHIQQARSKTGQGISIPLAPVIVEWFKELQVRAYGSDFVFPNRRTSKRFGHISPDTLNVVIQKLFKQGKMPVEHYTIHDLRRTCRSLLAETGVPGMLLKGV